MVVQIGIVVDQNRLRFAGPSNARAPPLARLGLPNQPARRCLIGYINRVAQETHQRFRLLDSIEQRTDDRVVGEVFLRQRRQGNEIDTAEIFNLRMIFGVVSR